MRPARSAVVRVAGLALPTMPAAIVALAVAACSDGTTPTCPQTDGGGGCSYAPFDGGSFGEAAPADALPTGETGSPDATE